VIVKLEAEEASALSELPGQLDVLRRGRGIPAGMVVGDNHVGGTFADCGSQHLARMGDGRGETADGDVVVAGQPILAIEEQDEEVFAPVIGGELSDDGRG
jgi:hypothetical protein